MNTTNFPNRLANPFRHPFRWFRPKARTRIVLKPAICSVPEASIDPFKKKILVVDDDTVIVKTTSMKLEANGYKAVSANDCSSAIEAVRKEKPDLILLDLTFPPDVGAVAWDGFLLMSWLHRLPEARNIPVIIMTGQEASKAKDKSMSCGALAYFQKPVNHVELLQVIQKTLAEAEPADFSV